MPPQHYRGFFPSFSQDAARVTYLTKGDILFQWTRAQQHAFDEVKEALQTTEGLVHFDQNSQIEIHIDTCDKGLAAVLIQRQDGVERAMAYASHALTKAEHNYSTTEKECLPVI